MKLEESLSIAGRPAAGFGLGQPDSCPALPSGSAAAALLDGDLTAIGPTIGYTGLRAVLIATGMVLAGEREHVVRNAVAGSLAIEAFVLGWAAWKRKQKTGESP
jgi:hypothetical protein